MEPTETEIPVKVGPNAPLMVTSVPAIPIFGFALVTAIFTTVRQFARVFEVDPHAETTQD